jgi:hypothetical protein
MSGLVFTAGLAAAVLVAIGSNLVVPVGQGIGSLFDVLGVGCAMVFIGMADGV